MNTRVKSWWGLAFLLLGCALLTIVGCANTQPERKSTTTIQEWLAKPRPGF